MNNTIPISQAHAKGGKKEDGEFEPVLCTALDESGCGDVKLMTQDRNKGIFIFIYCADETLSIPSTAEATAGFAIHWYTGNRFDAVRLTREKHTNKQI